MYCSTPAFSALHYLRSLFKFMSIESMTLSNHLILCLCLLICIQSFPTSVSFPMSCLFSSSGPSIRAWASASVLPMNIQDWFPLGWTGLISVQSNWLSWVFSNITVQKHQFFSTQPSLCTNSHILTWLLEKPQLWLCRLLSAKWCLCFLIHYPGLSRISFRGASAFEFHGWSHHPQWFWSPKK